MYNIVDIINIDTCLKMIDIIIQSQSAVISFLTSHTLAIPVLVREGGSGTKLLYPSRKYGLHARVSFSVLTTSNVTLCGDSLVMLVHFVARR